MLSNKYKSIVISILDSVLGFGTSLSGGEQVHHCPFCHHHKKKLQININTQQWHCWICDSKGRSISKLLKTLNCDKSKISKINEIYGTYTSYERVESVEEEIKLILPKEFKKLIDKNLAIDPVFDSVKRYLNKRGIDDSLIIKYNIGYCENGTFGKRIIVPSYDKHNQLNYFMARSYDDNPFKYKNPSVSKDVIGFENQINWNEEIVLCEGIFDAITIRRNAIPLFGKFIPPTLMETIFEKKVKSIKLMLDNDAQDQALKYVNYFMRNGISVTNIVPTEKDASEIGFKGTRRIIRNSTTMNWDDLVMSKLKGI
jgi:DNA primase